MSIEALLSAILCFVNGAMLGYVLADVVDKRRASDMIKSFLAEMQKTADQHKQLAASVMKEMKNHRPDVPGDEWKH